MDLNQDGVSDLMVGAFVVPGVFVMFGHTDSETTDSTAVTAAIISGVLGCLFCALYEARVWVREMNTLLKKHDNANDQTKYGSNPLRCFDFFQRTHSYVLPGRCVLVSALLFAGY